MPFDTNLNRFSSYIRMIESIEYAHVFTCAHVRLFMCVRRHCMRARDIREEGAADECAVVQFVRDARGG